jgi:hypothetical protein
LQVRRIAQRRGRGELAGLRAAEHHAATVGADPQSVFGRNQRRDPAIGQRLFVGAIVAQLAEFVSVETIEPVLGAEPHETFGVLRDHIDGLL